MALIFTQSFEKYIPISEKRKKGGPIVPGVFFLVDQQCSHVNT